MSEELTSMINHFEENLLIAHCDIDKILLMLQKGGNESNDRKNKLNITG